MASSSNITLQLQKLANENTQKTFQFNSAEAVKSRNWQTEMSNTSHQREVKDLIAAGLNPVLSSGGSGAQSYTTSSASGTADSAVNAIGGIEQSRLSAAATRYMADQNLAAARASAAAQLQAARIAASASNYYADKSYQTTKYQTDHSKSGSLPGVLSNIFNSAVNDKNSATIFSKQLNNAQSMRNNAANFLKDPNKKFSVGNMTQKALVNVNRQIKLAGLKDFTTYQRNVYIDAFLNHSSSAMRKWTQIINQHLRNYNSARDRVLSTWKSSF